MFLAVWMLYAADRILDARPAMDGSIRSGLEARHHFHHAQRRRFLGVLVAASLVLALLLHLADPRALQLYIVLATLLGTWLVLIHAHGSPARRLPKEIAVGLFFPAAVFIPSVARAPLLRPALLPAALLFAAVCALNCLFVYAWEHPVPDDSNARWTGGETSSTAPAAAHWSTLWATRYLVTLSGLAVALCGVALVVGRAHPDPVAPLVWLPPLACASSIALLMLLHMLRHRLSAIHLRACADLALMTPALPLVVLAAQTIHSHA